MLLATITAVFFGGLLTRCKPALWENSPADLGGAPTFHPVQLVLPARQSGREPEFCTGIFGQGATSQIDWNLCTSILGWGATSQINRNCAPVCLDGGLPVRSTGTYLPAYLDGWLPARSTGTMYQHTWMGGTSWINWNLCTGLLRWGATSQINWNYVPAYLYGGYHAF